MRWKHRFNAQKKQRSQPKKGQQFEISEQNLQQLFENCSDIHSQKMKFQEKQGLLLYCKGMIDEERLGEKVLPTIDQFLEKHELAAITQKEQLEKLEIDHIEKVDSKEYLIELVFTGSGLLYFPQANVLLSFNISSKPNRSVSETSMEVVIKGPRDNFIEDITTNMALIRKRLPTNSLRSEEIIVGSRSKTTLNVAYMDDMANKDILAELKKRLEAIDVDAIYSGEQLMELMEGKASLFPTYDYSARPDFIIKSLMAGRIIILIDGLPYCIITPVNFFLLLKSAEDSDFSYIFSSFERLIRTFGLLAATLLPGFWVALTSFHPNQLPITLLATVIESRKGIPLPAGLEALMMLLIFDLFREAGMRMPVAIGQTLSVVGGLIIGDAAIRAGLTSPSMLVVISASSVATYTLVNQSLIGTLSLVRIYILICAAFLGFFGFLLSFFSILLYLANMRVFGVPYLASGADLNFKEILKTFFHLPTTMEKKRAAMFNGKDKGRGGKS